MKKYNYLLWPIVIFVTGSIALAMFTSYYFNNEKLKSEKKVTNMLNLALSEMQNSTEKIALVVAGIKYFMDSSDSIPDQIEMQRYTNNLLDRINNTDPMVVSYIDRDHTFIYSYTRNEIDPAGLVGRNVKEWRSPEAIAKLDKVMENDDMVMFPPINLIEGWLGLPINFRVFRNGETIGYVAPIMSYKSILDRVYALDKEHEFVFQFKTDDGRIFDREKVYDETSVFNNKEDSEFYENYTIADADFETKELMLFGKTIYVSVALKDQYGNSKYVTISLIGWFLTFLTSIVAMSWFYRKQVRLSDTYEKQNNILEESTWKIENQNQRLLSLDKTKNKLFSIISHDIKQPMNAINGLIYLLKMETSISPGINDLLRKLELSTKSTYDLFDNLLRWAASQTGDLVYENAPLFLNELLDENLELLSNQAQLKKISFQVENSLLLEMEGDRNMIGTAIRNILSNAIKFTPDNGIISIQTRKYGQAQEIRITDTGVGMSQNQIDNLFNLDAYLSTVGTSGEKGTGLGMTLAREFIEKNNGSIYVDSSIGVGTTIAIVFKKV